CRARERPRIHHLDDVALLVLARGHVGERDPVADHLDRVRVPRGFARREPRARTRGDGDRLASRVFDVRLRGRVRVLLSPGAAWVGSNAAGSAVVDPPAGATTYVSAWATGYLIWSSVLTPAAGSNPLTIRLYPDLPQDVRIRGYVTDAVTNASIWPATIRVTGYDDQTPYAYADGTGYYEVWTIAAPQTVRAAATGHAAGEASVDPASGETLWVNL